MKPRRIDLAVISDAHLGTFSCNDKALLSYLKGIEPKVLVLNGDFIDGWHFSRHFWPKTHMKILKRILKLLGKGVQVFYVTGNHDGFLRRFTDFEMGNFHLVDKLVLEHEGKRIWIFHGDVFDVAMEHSRWVVWLGSAGYAILIILNRLVNFFLRRLGRGNLSVASRIKDSMHRARRYTEKFEQIAVDLAREKGYDAVVCGHIHHAKISVHHDEMGRKILYLNSGDWIENLTALEYEDGAWNIHRAVRHVDVEPEEADAPEHGPQDGWQDRPAVGWNLSSCKAVDG